jgi:hypothetical protein
MGTSLLMYVLGLFWILIEIFHVSSDSQWIVTALNRSRFESQLTSATSSSHWLFNRRGGSIQVDYLNVEEMRRRQSDVLEAGGRRDKDQPYWIFLTSWANGRDAMNEPPQAAIPATLHLSLYAESWRIIGIHTSSLSHCSQP